MKRVYYNETGSMLPHIRENFLKGRQQYKDQEQAVEFESSRTQEVLSGQLKQYGGVRHGYLTGDKKQSRR